MALLTDISKRVQDLFSPQKSPLPQRKQIQVKKNFVSQFANSPVGQALVGAQRAIEQAPQTLSQNINLIRTNPRFAQQLPEMINQGIQQGVTQTYGNNLATRTLGRSVGNIEKGFTRLVTTPFARKDVFGTGGDVLAGVGAITKPATGLGFGGFSAAIQAGSNLINRRPIGENVASEFEKGTQSGFQFAALEPVVGKILGPLANKIAPTQIKSINQYINLAKSATTPKARNEIIKLMSKRIAQNVLSSSTKGAVTFGGIGAVEDSKTLEERLNKTFQNALTGAVFSGGSTLAGYGAQALGGQIIKPLIQYSKANQQGKVGFGTKVGQGAKPNEQQKPMLPIEREDTAKILERMVNQTGNADYEIRFRARDEAALRDTASFYMNKDFAKNAPIQQVGQELLTRLKLDAKEKAFNLPSISMEKPTKLWQPPKQKSQSVAQQGGETIVNPKTGETLNDAIAKLEKYGWRKQDIQGYKDKILGVNQLPTENPATTLTSLNPTGGLYVDYTPQARMNLKLGRDITTYDKTSGLKPDQMVTIYRGVSKTGRKINPGDFITTDPNLAKSYGSNIIEKQVPASHILDDIKNPGAGEYIYRPSSNSRVAQQPFEDMGKIRNDNIGNFKGMEDYLYKGKYGGPTLEFNLNFKDLNNGNLSYQLIDKNGSKLGHIVGDVGYAYSKGIKGDVFDMTITHMFEGRGSGAFQKAIQEVANNYERGLITRKFQASEALQKALRKIPGVIETDEIFHIPNSKISKPLNPQYVKSSFDNSNFSISHQNGARAFGTINGNTANVVNIDTNGIKGMHFFEGVVNTLDKKGIKTINVKLQNEQSAGVLKRLQEKGILTNPRNVMGSSGNEYYATYDISNPITTPFTSDGNIAPKGYGAITNPDVTKLSSPQQPVGMLGKIKSTLKDQRGFIKFGEFVPPYKKGDVAKLKQGLKDELSTLPKPGGNKSRMEMLEYYAKQGDEAAQAQLELIRSMEQNIKLAQETKLSGKITPQGKSTKPSSPEIIPQGKKVRGFPQTVIDTKGVPKEIKDFAKTQTYDPLGNKEVLKTVSKIVKQGDAQAISFAKNNETVEGNATAMVMMRKLIDQNRIDEANDLIAAVSPRFTKQGQEIQILSQFSRLKPEGAIRWAQSFIDKANKANPRLKLQLKPSQTKMIIERAKKVQSLPEGSRERIVATAELIRDIKEVVPASWGQRIATIQTMSQLLNPKTLIRNVGGNTIFGGIENVSQTVGAGIDKGVSVFTGKRAVVKPSFSAQTKGFAKGLKEGTQDALKSIDTSGGVDTKFDLPTRTFTGKYNPLTYLEKAMNIALRAPDRASYQAAYNASIDNQLRASGTTKITPQMIETAHADGLYRTFQDNSRLAQIFTGTKKLLNKAGTPDGKFGVGDLILKYPKTPANLLARGLDYSPVGFAKGLYQGVRPLLTGQPFEQKAFVEALSRGLTGTGLISAGYILANNGILTGKPTKDYDLQAAQKELGTGPFRLNVDALKRFFFTAQKQKDQAGDNIISFDWAQPISLPFAMGANLKENPTSQDAFTSLVEQLDAGASTLTQQSLVQGVTNFAKDTGQYGPVRAFSNAALGAPSGFIPTFSNQIVQLGDNISKETYDPSALKQSFNRVISRIPFAQDSLPNKVGVLGQDQQRYQNNSNNFINVFLNPAFVSKISENPTAKEVLDIFNRSGETQQAPRVVDKKIKINGYMQSLTPTELGEYQRYVGVRADNMIRELMNDPNYQNMSDEGKATLIGNNLSNINSAAKIELFGNNPKKVDRGVKNVIGGAYQNKEDVNTTTYDTQSGFGAKAEASDGMYSYIDKNGDYQTIDISEPIEYPKLTGSKAADKELISTYKSKISSRVNDIRTLYEDGKITEEEFVSLIDELQTQLDKNSTGKGRKGTKLKLPTPKALPVLQFSKRPLYKAPKLGTKIPKAPRFSVKKPNTRAVFAKPSKERLTIRTVRA